MESNRYHQISKNHSAGKRLPDISRSEWPIEWMTIYYKDYERLPKISLSHDPLPPADLGLSIETRVSGDTPSGNPLTQQELSWLLKYSCGLQKGKSTLGVSGSVSSRRSQPSGGGQYPVEVYVLVFIGGEVPQGTYHYNVKTHALDVLENRTFSKEDIDGLFTYDWVSRASAAVIMTGVFARNQDKYGERGYRYTLFEAGHIAQNLALVATSLSIQSRPMGGTYDHAQERNLDIDGMTESLLYSVVLGK